MARKDSIEIKKTIPIIRVVGGHFPLPLVMRGPDYFKNVVSADYCSNPINGTPLVSASFEQNAELADYALRHKEDSDVASVIDSINGSGKVLTGNSMIVTSPKRVYFIQFPDRELVEQFGVNNQDYLTRVIDGFDKRLKGSKEQNGVVYGDGIRAISAKGVPSGEINKRDFKSFPGLVGMVGSLKTAKGIVRAVKEDYALDPYFSLNVDSTNLATRIPVFYSAGFADWLLVYGRRSADLGDRCSFGVSRSAEGARVK